MVWQRAGTVSVQAGSTAVVGAGVDFAASSRVGDSFIGPDGVNYEVANVASATVISILPAYKGPTVSGAAYAIMPVQGYDKMLSDAFNNLNNQFGPKLAALGTTGNYDILPVLKGGTGRDSLGNAISLDRVASITDLTAGRLLITGSGGVLGAPVAITNANNAVAGTRAVTTITEAQAADANFPVLGGSGTNPRRWYLSTDQLDSGSSIQTATETYGVGVVPGRVFMRTMHVTWRAWVEVLTSGNTTRAADGTLKAI